MTTIKTASAVKKGSKAASRATRITEKTVIPLSCRMPPISVADLALMLEIDLAMGQKKDFTKRLIKALNAVTELSNQKKH